MRVLLPVEMGSVDSYLITELQVPGVVLMENAGGAVAKRVAEIASSRRATSVVVLCGPGNNGGDGFAAARRLVSQGLSVGVYVFCPRAKVAGDAETHLRWLMHWGLRPCFVESCTSEVSGAIQRADIIVDSLLGTGVRGEVAGPFAEAIALINSSSGSVVSVDMPSGIDGATGRVLGSAVRADITVTFAYPKIGQLLFPGRQYCGQLEIVDIGVPPIALAEAGGVQSTMSLMDAESVRELLPRRVQPSHKGTYGQLVVIAGSVGMPGAASLTCAGALRSGTGTVVAIVPRSVQPILHCHNVEVMTVAADESEEGGFSADSFDLICDRLAGATAFVIGPGIGRGSDVTSLVERLLAATSCVGVVDADALMALARSHVDLASCRADLVLTPHPGEMSALTGLPSAEIAADPVQVCARYAVEWCKTVILKGATTVVGSPDGSLHISTRGNAGLATGGTGDVLAGVVGGLLAQGVSVPEAAIAGTYVHGVAGELASQSTGMAGMLAREVASAVPLALEYIANPTIGVTALR